MTKFTITKIGKFSLEEYLDNYKIENNKKSKNLKEMIYVRASYLMGAAGEGS